MYPFLRRETGLFLPLVVAAANTAVWVFISVLVLGSFRCTGSGGTIARSRDDSETFLASVSFITPASGARGTRVLISPHLL